MQTVTYNIYSINEHPNKDAVFNWVRDNWHDLNQYEVDELIKSLKALVSNIGGSLDYGISQVPDRGEFISITDYNREALKELNEKIEEYPLTGCFWDYEVIKGLINRELGSHCLKILHDSTEYVYSDEGLTEMLEANDYYFKENGEFRVNNTCITK
ncbi:hypothetical protein [Marinicella marina]|uniref:hypothetical protein n=1 Tax=Marinicella marina TaxID=2996016 RepID=UPI0024BD2B98|nr:hypothetical protein [Marinicella marina]MDJ1139619.1 hypothetical protein [Marinicella marina]